MNNDKLLSVDLVAGRLGLSPGTVRNMLRDPMNPLRGVKIGRSIRIYESSLKELLLEGEKAMFEM